MIRIGAGSARRRALKTPKGERPTLGRLRTTLFDILAPRLEGRRFLDIFAGSGAVGIEALSQGAGEATFIERKARHAAIIRENLERCGLAKQARVICAEAAQGLARLRREKAIFDIAFLDPPFDDIAALRRALGSLTQEPGLMPPEGLIIIQRSRRSELGDISPEWQAYDSRLIGESALDFLRRKSV